MYSIQHYVIKFVSDLQQVVYATNKTDHHDITEIFLKVALYTITPLIPWFLNLILYLFKISLFKNFQIYDLTVSIKTGIHKLKIVTCFTSTGYLSLVTGFLILYLFNDDFVVCNASVSIVSVIFIVPRDNHKSSVGH